MRAAGAQGEVLKLFSTALRTRLEAPWKPRTQLSHAVGCLAGIVGLHRTNATDGIFLGIDAVRRAPIPGPPPDLIPSLRDGMFPYSMTFTLYSY